MNDFASFAESPRQPHTAALDCFPASPPTSATSGNTAPITSQTPAPVGLRRRAFRLFPHKRLARARYLQAHDELRENLSRIRGN